MNLIDQKISDITEKVIEQVCDCRYEDDKIHIHIHNAIAKIRRLLKQESKT